MPSHGAWRDRPKHMNDKRVLMAALASSIFMILYSQIVLKNQRVVQRPTILNQQLTVSNSVTSQKHSTVLWNDEASKKLLSEETNALLRSGDLEVEVGRRSGAVKHARLLKFTDKANTNPLELGGSVPLIWPMLNEETSTWKVVKESTNQTELELNDHSGHAWRIAYSVDESRPVVAVSITELSGKDLYSEHPLKVYYGWGRADRMAGRNNQLEAVTLEGNKSYKKYMAPVRTVKEVPRGTTTLSLAERYFCLIVKPTAGSMSVKLLPTGHDVISAEATIQPGLSNGNNTFTADVYIGPMDYFHRKSAGFEEAFKIGILGQIGLILLIALSWIAKVTGNYGVAIILLSALITCALAPFTLLSFRSMKKMQELKPKMDKLMAQHKNDPKKANQEVLALYREHKVSPLSGCLPMLIQMPIFIALFQAISHFIELRGKSFLWVSDLSLPDRVAHLPFSLPVLGNELNILPLAMALVMFLQTKLSQKRMGADQSNPTAQMMSGPIMPVLFGFMFYQFPAGLVLYWITNSIISLAWYRFAQ